MSRTFYQQYACRTTKQICDMQLAQATYETGQPGTIFASASPEFDITRGCGRNEMVFALSKIDFGLAVMTGRVLDLEDAWTQAGRPTFFLHGDLSGFLGASKYASTLSEILPNKADVFSVSQPDRPGVLVSVNDDGVDVCWMGQGRFCAIDFRKNPAREMMIHFPWHGSIESARFVGQFDSVKVLARPEIATLAKTVFGFMAFRAAFPEQVFEGFPEDMKESQVRNSIATPRTVKLTKKLTQSPSAHWRNGCFRTLKDERYKRNPDGTYRVIYANGCVVGKIKPSTATLDLVIA